MKNVVRIRWLSRLDMEPLLSTVLTWGMFLSASLMVAGLIAGRGIPGGVAPYKIHAVGVPQLLQADLHRAGSAGFWHRLLVDLGFSVLLVTPYLRLTLTWLYLAFVKRRLRYAFYTGPILIFLAIVVFSDFVFKN